MKSVKWFFRMCENIRRDHSEFKPRSETRPRFESNRLACLESKWRANGRHSCSSHIISLQNDYRHYLCALFAYELICELWINSKWPLDELETQTECSWGVRSRGVTDTTCWPYGKWSSVPREKALNRVIITWNIRKQIHRDCLLNYQNMGAGEHCNFFR